MGSFKHALQAVMITLMAANTFAVGLRIWVRTSLMKVYGWDDIALGFAYVGFLVACGFGFTTIHFGFAADNGDDTSNFDYDKMMKYYAANQYALYISSGIIKIAVALVLYRLACGLKSQVILVMAIIVMVIWTFITTIFAMGLCASASAASYTGEPACTAIGYFRMISNIFVDYFFALFPIPMLWAATLSRRMKIIVCCLLGLGLIASAATVAKLILLVTLETERDAVKVAWIHTQLLIWSDAELGVAIFTATMSGLRPLVRRILGHKPARWSETAAAATRGTAYHSGAYPRALAGDASRLALNNNRGPVATARNVAGATKSSDDVSEFEMRRVRATARRPVAEMDGNDDERPLRSCATGDEYHSDLRRSGTILHGLPEGLSRGALSPHGYPPPYRMPTVPVPAMVRSEEAEQKHELP